MRGYQTLCGKTTLSYTERQILVHSPNQVTFSHNQHKGNVPFEGNSWSLYKTMAVNIHAITDDVIKRK